ncbi:MAG: tryptophan--tRNA ligase [Acidimicrobiia bacterium]|nr:tryptophan--tRNA ligase [Acidimicrobiia bacterium]NNF11087.1 tryptophan--tRNA ligase [Acidimicrobiia bacterium]NNL69035.1 tryptophan--tRNA ligase [Acidimicrobiia bacterium]
MAKQVVFSGIQPTGDIHIGNYLGALRNWVRLQDDYDTIYCIVDLHALTIPQDPTEFEADRLRAAKMVIAAGVDPTTSLFYYQSQVPQHTELSWILGTLTQLGALNRMTQFKEKADQAGENLGLYSYPVLMAADILIHHAHKVPVGDDQTQHLELARDLAGRFNRRFGDEFPVPEGIIPEHGARIMSLQDPTSKMSKSDPNLGSRILLLDDPDTVRKKIGRAVTDSGSGIEYDWDNKPGITNLLEILSLFTDTAVDALVEEHHDKQYGAFKQLVAEAVVDGLAPIRSAYSSLEDAEVSRLMNKGALDARSSAEKYQVGVREKLGLTGH